MSNPLVKPVEAENQLILSALKATVKEGEANRYIGFCPVHETLTSNPSLLIYENTSGYLGFSCLSRHCKHTDIVAAIRDKFGITVPYPAKKLDTGGQVNIIVNYPAHDSSLPLKYRKPEDTIYEYYCETGEIAFLVQRYESMEKGKLVKQIRPFFSKTFINDEGLAQKDWDALNPPKHGRPMYNLFNIQKDQTKPVLIVEGEKTAVAASKIPELKKFLITTWSGGTSFLKATDWKPLANRDTSIYLWPDADEAGSRAMKDIAARLTQGFNDNRFFILDYSKLGVHQVEKGWDLADEAAGPENQYSIEEMLASFKPYKTDDTLAIGTLEEEIAQLNKDLSLLNMAGSIYYVALGKSTDSLVLPYVFWNSLASLKAEKNKQVLIEMGDKTKRVSSVAEWAANPTKEAFIGLAFRPDKDTIVETPMGRKINLFTGFPNFGTDRNDILVNLFNEYMEKIVANPMERTWLLDQMRLSLQQPAVKPGNAIILIGRQGSGKSTYYRTWASVLGSSNAKYMGEGLSGFNDVMARSILMGWDEFEIDHKRDVKAYNTLKTWITEPKISINPKGLPAFEVESFHRFVLTSNNINAITLPPEDRRFFVCSIGPDLIGNKTFFTKLYSIIDPTHTYAARMDEPVRLAAMAGFAHWLRTTKITTEVMEVPSTLMKQETATSSSKIMEVFRQMYADRQLPAFMADLIMPDEAVGFGARPIKIPQPEFARAFSKEYGRDHMSNTANRKPLVQHFMEYANDGFSTKLYHMTLPDGRGGSIYAKRKCYVLWPIDEGRAKLDLIEGVKLLWPQNDEVLEVESGKSNVIDINTRDELF